MGQEWRRRSSDTVERNGFCGGTWTEEADLVTELGCHFKHTFGTPGFVEERSEGCTKGVSKLRVSTRECQ